MAVRVGGGDGLCWIGIVGRMARDARAITKLCKAAVRQCEELPKAALRDFLNDFFEGAGQAVPMDRLSTSMLVEVLLHYTRQEDQESDIASDIGAQPAARDAVHKLVDRILDKGPQMDGFMQVCYED